MGWYPDMWYAILTGGDYDLGLGVLFVLFHGLLFAALLEMLPHLWAQITPAETRQQRKLARLQYRKEELEYRKQVAAFKATKEPATKEPRGNQAADEFQKDFNMKLAATTARAKAQAAQAAFERAFGGPDKMTPEQQAAAAAIWAALEDEIDESTF